MRVLHVVLLLALAQLACGDGGGPSSADRTDRDASPGGIGSPHDVADGGLAQDAGSGNPSTSDDGGGATPNDASATTPSCNDLPICDDFEAATAGGLPDSARWSIATPSCSGTGSVSIDGAVAHSGARSVKVTGAGGYCNHVFFATSSALTTIGAHLFARFFVRFADPLGDGHVTFLAMKDATSSKDLRMGGQDKVLMWNRESDDATLPAMSPAGTAKSVSPETQRWLCVELEVDGAAGAMRTWIDGALVDGLVDDGAPTPDIDAQWLTGAPFRPALRDARFGWESYGGQAETLWFDDIALAAQRIGCGP